MANQLDAGEKTVKLLRTLTIVQLGLAGGWSGRDSEDCRRRDERDKRHRQAAQFGEAR